jgi:NDP-sugar pyrophosphorylase family protein
MSYLYAIKKKRKLMKAMIFAAGLGTRLRPLTNNKPKALVEYKGKTLLEICIRKIINSGFDEIIINVHHFAGQIIKFLEKNNYFDTKIHISDETKQLLETGGGLFFAKHFFDNEPFLVHNVDIISSIDIEKLYSYHIENQAIATLATQKRQASRRLYFDKNSILCKWKNEKTGEEKIARTCEYSQPKAFSGIHVISPKIFEYMHTGKYSIIDTYLQVAQSEKIIAFDHTGDNWKDMGRPENFID